MLLLFQDKSLPKHSKHLLEKTVSPLAKVCDTNSSVILILAGCFLTCSGRRSETFVPKSKLLRNDSDIGHG